MKKSKMRQMNEILKEQISLRKLNDKEEDRIKEQAGEIIQGLEKNITRKKVKAEVFIGGSLAKGTLVKKEKPDIDIFVRFDKNKYEDDKLSDVLSKIIGNSKGIKRVHGSRDYFQIVKHGILFEIVPVVKISKPQEARNVTDLSYFHVNYVKNKIKQNKRLADEIILAKVFCHAQNCYGAESYINGFSGYALELLILYYGSFLKFIKAVQAKQSGKEEKDKKIILDPAKHYKSKEEVSWEINESKLQSPVVLIDPTFKERNALAALSKETFEKFKNQSQKFLENPNKKFFVKQKTNEKQYNLIIETKTNRQRGDIAGSKLRKFYDFLIQRMQRFFSVQKAEFNYNEKQNTGRNYFKIKTKKEIVHDGPRITNVYNLVRFKKAHKGKNEKCYIEQGRAYCKEKISITPKKFINDLKKKDKKILKEMGLSNTEIVR